MVKWPRLLLMLAAGALAAWAWLAWHPSPEKLVRRQLAGLARAASFGPNQGGLAKLSGAEKLADFFSANVDVNINLPGRQEHRLAGREEIQQAALALRGSVPSMTVAFPDVAVLVNADQQSALADVTLQVNIAGEANAIVQEVKFTLRQIEGQWQIVKVETVRTLQ
jgi:hypothetical protein